MDELKQEIKFGDLVRWGAEGSIRVGVVTFVHPDSTASVNYQRGKETTTYRIRIERLERIVSTIEPEPPAASREVAPAAKATKVVKPKAKKGTRKKKAAAKGKSKKTGTSRKGKAKGRKKSPAKKSKGKKGSKKRAAKKKKA